PFMVATALARGADGLVTFCDDTLRDPDIRQLASFVRVEEKNGPTGRSIVDGGEVLIEGPGLAETLTASGIRPLSTDELEVLAHEKFERYSSGFLSEGQVSEAQDLVRDLAKLGDIKALAQTTSGIKS
ncbi:MAG: hypothetical protein ACREHV_01715, partial [Rhizomicrobium sp.]